MVAHTVHKQQNALRLTVRLFCYALPHWRLAAVAVVGMALYAGTKSAQIALVKPVILRMTAANETEGGSGNQTEEPKSHGAMKWLRRFGPARHLEQAWVAATRSLYSIGMLAVALAPAVFVSCFWQEYFRAKVLWSVVVDLRNELCCRLLPYQLSFFENRSSGTLISSLTNDILTTQKSLRFLFGDIFLQPIQVLFLLGLALHYSWPLTLLTFLAAPAIIIPMRIFGSRVRRQSRGSLERLADLTDVMSQLFTGIRVVKAFKMEQEESAEFAGVNHGYFTKVMKLAKARATVASIMEFIYVMGLAAVLILGGIVIREYGLTAADFGGFLAAVGLMVHPVKRLTKAYNVLQESLAAAERVFHLMDLDARLPDAPDPVRLERFEQGIEFRHVSFAYDSLTVLTDVSFTASKGQVVAFVGESGAGKTTLLNLVPRFYDPTEGCVEVDGIDVRRIERDSLLDHIAIVTQQPFLFNRSIADNIRYGQRDAGMDRIVAAATAAYIHDFVSSLPEGYDTSVGELGEKLSGGQRQRVTIARAILKDPSILILDEATSALDSDSERQVQAALSNLMEGRTTLVIAHRLSTVQHADKLVVVKQGRIVEEGTHAELLARGGEYRRLHDMQLLAPGQGE